MWKIIDYNIFNNYEIPIRDKCREIIFNAETLDDIKSYIKDILGKLIGGDKSILSEAIGVVIPLSYRLGIDDSSGNYRIASEIKEECCRLLYPNFYNALNKEAEYIFRSFTHTNRQKAEYYLNDFLKHLEISAKNVFSECYTYGRIKKPYSIFEKFQKYYHEEKKIKEINLPYATSLISTLNKFENNIIARMDGGNKYITYSNEEINWILPDLIATTVQFSNNFINSKNIGLIKNRYKIAFEKIKNDLSLNVYYGPKYSEKWHMNRLVFYTLLKIKKVIRIPIEVFIRTDLDYFIGYANYWRYKSLDLFGIAQYHKKTEKNRFYKEIKSFNSFIEVQQYLLKEIKTGQMSLF